MSPSSRRLLALVAVVAVLLAAGVAWLVGDDEPSGPVAVDADVPSATAEAPTPTPTPVRKPPKAEPACRAAPSAFTPTSMEVAGVTPGSPVVAMPRDANGVVGVPPLTTAGKAELAWDAPGVEPGSPAGHALFNAHTWPDGSALGNRLLDGLDTGGRLVVRGAGGERLCYDVTRRVEVTAETLMPEIYAADGPPQLVIIVCSGVRRGPGDWSHRTLWFAEPA